MLLPGFGEQVRVISFFHSRCVGTQGEEFFPKMRWCIRKKNVKTGSIKNKIYLNRVMRVHTHDYI